VVMTANAANYALDSLLMLRLGWGMAGCGWASVISQVRPCSSSSSSSSGRALSVGC
jgi:Na+-driven multidrug efflux pump